MLGKDEEKQSQFMFINLDDFVPQDHLLNGEGTSVTSQLGNEQPFLRVFHDYGAN